ncbi:hypothetical protein MHI18_02060 [Peribacillus sp. FSL H8-0477]|uniref:hypothetical protein n=1 Tax=Peribacillus sp. FSL H8-0477 TaxID=2921388 RepID=UPI0030FAB06F
MNKKEEQELNERLNRIEQHERLRKAEGKEQYKDTSKEIESLSIQMINKLWSSRRLRHVTRLKGNYSLLNKPVPVITSLY